MEDRYEIRSKIGQGGLGAVYRAYDTRMSREVAIKRISTAEKDPSLKEESTRQLIKEAGALASLQHPHIVTVYDVGADEDGPYVVMELIAGKTLDELLENAPLTWPDFRELAMQTQEALIAAQELHIIHADIKPSNLMLTWLPSGKFQVKVVDFGLATLSHGQSKQELETMEAVYGSIFFMAPEQFERVPLDARTDLYAMACVYYQALTGNYPFNGRTGNEVMEAHLKHTIVPLQEVREGIPLWICEWIMWNLNRLPSDRPESARQALQVFLQNDRAPQPALSTGTLGTAKRPPFTSRALGPKSIQLSRPGTPKASTQLHTLSPKTKTAPQPLLPPEGSKPSVHTSAHTLPLAPPIEQPLLVTPVGKKGLSTGVKLALGSLAAAIICGGAYLKFSGGKMGSGADLAPILTQAATAGAREISVNGEVLKLLLNAASQPKATMALKALSLAKASDASDVDRAISEFTFKDPRLSAEAREALIRQVIAPRRNPLAVAATLEFAKTTSASRLAAAALQAIQPTASEDHFKLLMEMVQTHANDEVRNSAEGTLLEIISRNDQPGGLAAQLNAAYIKSPNLNARDSLQHLLAACGSEQTLRQIKESLATGDSQAKLAAITSLGYWPDEMEFPTLIALAQTSPDSQIKDRAATAALTFLTTPKHARNANLIEKLWPPLAPLLTTPEQVEKALALLETQAATHPWAASALAALRAKK